VDCETKESSVKYSESEMKRYHCQILRMYDEGFSVKQIAEQVGYSQRSLYSVFKRYGVELQGRREPSPFKGKHHTEEAKLKNKLAHLGRVPANRFHTLNEDYFKEIDTKEKAYWLGFIAADGCVTNNRGWHFSWGSKDKEVLEQFLLDIQASHKAKPLRPGYFYISFANQRFIKNLMSHGIVPNKTSKLKFPDLNYDLVSHFTRGFFDGDGCVSSSGGTPNITFASGSPEFLDSLRSIIDDAVSLKKKRLYRDKRCYHLMYRGCDAIKVGIWMYKDATRCLKRKRETFECLRRKINGPIS